VNNADELKLELQDRIVFAEFL